MVEQFSRRAVWTWVPYLAVVGERERVGNCVAVRSRKEGELGEVNVDAVVEKLHEEVRMRAS